MKSNLILFIFALLIGSSLTLGAQNNSGTTTIIKKIISADGNVNEEKIILEGDQMDEYLERIESEHTGAISVKVKKENEDATISITIDEREAAEGENESTQKEVKIFKFSDVENSESITEGQVTVDVEEKNGKKVVTIVKDGETKIIEIEGDENHVYKDNGQKIIILSEDDESTFQSESEINVNVEENNGKKVITIIKDGAKKIIESDGEEDFELKEEGDNIIIINADDDELREKFKRKTYLGIRMENTVEKNDFGNGEISSKSAIKVLNTIPDSPAEKAGVLANDIVKGIDNNPLENMENLLDYLGDKNVGDEVILNIERGGIEKNIPVILGQFNLIDAMDNHQRTWKEKKANSFNHASNSPHYGNRVTRHKVKRDPCKPFIGVSTDHFDRGEENGLTINRVIENTPADRSSLQKGDVIIEMDGQKVNSIRTLRAIRDAHDAGDRFKLTILRDGKRKKIKSSFNDCDNNNSLEEIIDIGTDENMELSQLDFSIFPNPSTGNVNVAYKGNPGSMTLNIMDISGKILLENTIADFDGSYQEAFDFSDYQVGTLLIQIENGGEKLVEKLILQNLN